MPNGTVYDREGSEARGQPRPFSQAWRFVAHLYHYQKFIPFNTCANVLVMVSLPHSKVRTIPPPIVDVPLTTATFLPIYFTITSFYRVPEEDRIFRGAMAEWLPFADIDYCACNHVVIAGVQCQCGGFADTCNFDLGKHLLNSQ